MADAKCGAKTRSGAPCQSRQMANGRCRMHGGTNAGAPSGNQNRVVHGIYGDLLRGDESALADSVRSTQGIEDELLIVRFQLRRALKAQALADVTDDGLELDERTEREGAENATARPEEKFRRRDYNAIIDRLVARIESLNKTRITILGDKTPNTDDMMRDDTFIAPDEPLPDAPIL